MQDMQVKYCWTRQTGKQASCKYSNQGSFSPPSDTTLGQDPISTSHFTNVGQIRSSRVLLLSSVPSFFLFLSPLVLGAYSTSRLQQRSRSRGCTIPLLLARTSSRTRPTHFMPSDALLLIDPEAAAANCAASRSIRNIPSSYLLSLGSRRIRAIPAVDTIDVVGGGFATPKHRASLSRQPPVALPSELA
jgi:hypothetical protein